MTVMAVTKVAKRSISLPIELNDELEELAAVEHTSVSALLAEAARRDLLIRRGLRGVEQWEAEHGPLTDAELAEADAILDAVTDDLLHITPTIQIK